MLSKQWQEAIRKSKENKDAGAIRMANLFKDLINYLRQNLPEDKATIAIVKVGFIVNGHNERLSEVSRESGDEGFNLGMYMGTEYDPNGGPLTPEELERICKGE